MSQLVMTRRHEPNPSLNFGFDEYCPRSAQLDIILHSLARNSKRLPKIESCDDKTPTYGSGNNTIVLLEALNTPLKATFALAMVNTVVFRHLICTANDTTTKERMDGASHDYYADRKRQVCTLTFCQLTC